MDILEIETTILLLAMSGCDNGRGRTELMCVRPFTCGHVCETVTMWPESSCPSRCVAAPSWPHATVYTDSPTAGQSLGGSCVPRQRTSRQRSGAYIWWPARYIRR